MMPIGVLYRESIRRGSLTAFRIASWGVLLGFVYGAISGVAKMAAHDYLHLGLYRLAAVEITNALFRSTLFLAGTVLVASFVSWVLRHTINRLVARLHLNTRRIRMFAVPGLLVLISLVLFAVAAANIGYIVEWLKATPAAPFLRWVLRFWREAAFPSHFGTVVFALLVIVAPAIRWLANRRGHSRLLPKLFANRKVPALACVVVVLLVLLGSAVAVDHAFHKVEGNNVVLITVDTLRADHLGCYGYMRNTSPEMDKLAQSGILFADAFSPSNWTLPSVSTIHTSLYPSEHGAVTKDRRFPDSCVTLAEVLRNAGYRTMAVVSHYFVSRKYGFAQGFDVFDQMHMAGHDAVTSRGITDTTVRLLRSVGNRPFFLWVHYFDPHYTYIHHEEYDFGSDYSGSLPDILRYEEISAAKQDLGPTDVQYVRDIYDEEIAYTDRWVGELVQAVHDLGLQKNTLIILTADHGEEFMERGDFGHHAKLYNELIHVPLIIAGAVEPGLRGAVVKNSVEVRHVSRTILDTCGIESEEIGGESLFNAVAGGAEPAPCFSEGTNPGEEDDRKVAVFDKGRKLIWDLRGQRYELYDLRDDPHERIDLLQKEPQEARLLQNLLDEKVRGFLRQGGRAVPRLDFKKNELQHLRSLGYVE